MSKYRKKPVVIEAMQFDGNNQRALIDWADPVKDGGESVYLDIDDDLTVMTPHGDTVAEPGDYIVKDVEGEFYPCSASIFEATHEKVEA